MSPLSNEATRRLLEKRQRVAALQAHGAQPRGYSCLAFIRWVVQSCKHALYGGFSFPQMKSRIIAPMIDKINPAG